MGHCIQGLVFQARLSAAARARTARCRMLRLSQGFVLMPISESLFDELGDVAPPDAVGDGFTRLSQGVVQLARELSTLGPVAYVETDYFGGVGVQSAAAWMNGEEAMPPTSHASDVINAALQTIGVRRDASMDEFDAAGLGRFRSNERWLERGEPIGS